MLQGNKTLKNPFYFIKDKVIFKITDKNYENDICGKHYKTFDTVSQALKKGQTYLDANENLVEAPSDGNYNVNKGTDTETATITANKAKFPFYELTYSYLSDGIQKTRTDIFWLDNLISVGDKVETNGQFKNKTVHSSNDTEEEKTYESYFKSELLKEINDMIKSGYPKEYIENEYAMFMGNNKEATIDGLIVKVTNVTSSVKITESDIINEIKNVIQQYGNKLLLPYSKECNITLTDKR